MHLKLMCFELYLAVAYTEGRWHHMLVTCWSRFEMLEREMKKVFSILGAGGVNKMKVNHVLFL